MESVDQYLSAVLYIMLFGKLNLKCDHFSGAFSKLLRSGFKGGLRVVLTQLGLKSNLYEVVLN